MLKNYQKICLISTDHDFNEALIDQFELKGSLKIEVFNSFSDFSESQDVRLIVFNDLIDNTSNFKDLTQIKDISKRCPIILLADSARNQASFDLKKIDEIVTIEKPFRCSYLEEIVFQQINKNASKCIFLNRLKFFPSKKILIDNENIEIRLTEKESEILIFLYDKLNQIVSKRTLLNEIWGYKDEITTHTLETHLYYLRKKLGDEILISTRKGGYSLSL